MRRVYKYKIVRHKKFRKGEPVGNAYHFFITTLGILKDLNKILPESFEAYKENLLKEHRNQIDQMDAVGRRELEKYVKLMKSVTKENFKAGTIHITSKKLAEILKEQGKLGLYSSRFNMFIKEMSLVYLVTEFEQLLGRMLSIVFGRLPKSLISSQKNMNYQEILSAKKIEDLRERIIDQEVNSIIAQDVEEVCKCLKDKFKFDVSSFPPYRKVKERFYRRHIVIHNNCYPDEKYRRKTGYKGPRKRLAITQIYLMSSINLFEGFATAIKGSLEKKTGIKIG